MAPLLWQGAVQAAGCEVARRCEGCLRNSRFMFVGRKRVQLRRGEARDTLRACKALRDTMPYAALKPLVGLGDLVLSIPL